MTDFTTREKPSESEDAQRKNVASEEKEEVVPVGDRTSMDSFSRWYRSATFERKLMAVHNSGNAGRLV